MDEQLKQVLQRTRSNAFTNYNHMELETVEPDHAVFRLEIRPESKNPYGMVHGGALYAMADNAAGVAAHTDGQFYVTQSGTLHFVRNQGAGIIRSAGRVRHRGSTTCLVEVDITGEGGKLLATGEFTYFRVDPALVERQAQADAGAEQEGTHA